MPLFKKSTTIPPAPPPPPLPGNIVDKQVPSSETPTNTANEKLSSPTPPSTVKQHTQLANTEKQTTPPPNIAKNKEEINNQQTDIGELEVSSTGSSDSDLTKTEPTQKSTENKKPHPPAKSSRLQKALSSGSLTLRRLSLKNSKKKESKRLSMTEVVQEEDDTKTSQLREAPLWKLPGMDLGAKKDRTSSTTAAEKVIKTETTVNKDDMHKLKRELPPLPQDDKSSPKKDDDTNHRLLPSLPTQEPINEAPLDETSPRPSTPTLSEKSSSVSEGFHVSTENGNSNKLDDSMEHDEEDPPPLPARPLDLTPLSSRKVSQISTMPDMALRDAIHKYSGCYPLRFRVLQGYCSDSTDVNMSTDDVYDIHLVKETKVILVKSDNGMTYRIPLGSPQKVGLIYNPTNDYEKGLNGHVFKSVADITSMPVLPKVVCVTQEARSNDGKYLVDENEVLIVRQIHRTLFKGKKGLKVFSMLSKTEKTLPDDCTGYFSTKPSLVRLHLPEIIEYVSKPFPVRAVLYSAGENVQSPEQPGSVTGVVTITEYSTETSLVVSAVACDENQDLVEECTDIEPDLFDIPLDDEMRDLEIAILHVSTQTEIEEASDSDDSDHVYDDTINVLKHQDFTSSGHLNINTSTGHLNINTSTGHLNINTSSGYLNDSQTMLNSSMNCGDFARPLSMQFVDERPSVSEYNEEDEMDGYDTVGLHLLQSNPSQSRPAVNNRGYDDSFHGSDPRLTSWVEDLQTTTRGIENRLMSLETNKGSSEMTKMQDMLLQLTRKLESVDTQLQTISSQEQQQGTTTQQQQQQQQQGTTTPAQMTTAEPVDERSPEEINRAYLSTLSMEEVCVLFDAMSLSQYNEHIEREFVSGDILTEFDDEVLRDELEIKSKIQRIRLLKVIKGQHSARDILNK